MTPLSQQEIEQRAQRAKELFLQGFNCSQSVLASCCDLYGLDETTALRVAAAFGGGIARMRHVCGAASGMFMLAGLENGSVTGSADEKKANYALVRELADDFRQEHGSIICSDLLGIAPQPESPVPAKRTEEYYHKRPCGDIIASAVRLYLLRLSEKSSS